MSAPGQVVPRIRSRGRAGTLAAAARRRPVPAAALVAAVSLLGFVLLRHFALHLDLVDLLVYRAEGRAVLDHQSLHALRATRAHLQATYPPFAALLFTPLAALPVGLLRALVTAGNIGLLALLAHLSCRYANWPGRRGRPVVVVLAAGLGVWLEPVWTTLNYGQINLLLACLVLWDLTRPDDRRSKGVAIGIAAGIKLTPGLFAVYLLLSGRIRAAVVAAATGLGTALLGAVLLPGDSLTFWTRDLFDAGRVGKTWIVDNQSLRGMLARLSHTAEPGGWAVLVVGVVGLLGLAVAVATARRGALRGAAPRSGDGAGATPGGAVSGGAGADARTSGVPVPGARGFGVRGFGVRGWGAAGGDRVPRAEAWGGVCCGFTALLVSPISWSHHWVWCVPALVLLAAEASAEAARRIPGRVSWRVALGVAVLVFTSQCLWLVPHPGDHALHLALWQQPFASGYPLAALAFLGIAGFRLVRRPRGGAGTIAPEPVVTMAGGSS
ncbi:glycosyltransferase 87 family protein [Streptacidiphilus sp. EB129]|uniref:glycosyltransferase 87 family protein n=1 Tax=Streptacidiphilus sp. EB129 TaxID=3156262 RepID=UPI003519C6C3